jgi:hypothetical protein
LDLEAFDFEVRPDAEGAAEADGAPGGDGSTSSVLASGETGPVGVTTGGAGAAGAAAGGGGGIDGGASLPVKSTVIATPAPMPSTTAAPTSWRRRADCRRRRSLLPV